MLDYFEDYLKASDADEDVDEDTEEDTEETTAETTATTSTPPPTTSFTSQGELIAKFRQPDTDTPVVVISYTIPYGPTKRLHRIEKVFVNHESLFNHMVEAQHGGQPVAILTHQQHPLSGLPLLGFKALLQEQRQSQEEAHQSLIFYFLTAAIVHYFICSRLWDALNDVIVAIPDDNATALTISWMLLVLLVLVVILSPIYHLWQSFGCDSANFIASATRSLVGHLLSDHQDRGRYMWKYGPYMATVCQGSLEGVK